MLTVPRASIGAFGSLFIFSAPLNLYSMLGIVTLIGLVAKNGILLETTRNARIETGAPQRFP